VVFDGETPAGAIDGCKPNISGTIYSPGMDRFSIWPKSSLVLRPIMALSASLSASALAGGVAVY
jgi:hypothetical protein